MGRWPTCRARCSVTTKSRITWCTRRKRYYKGLHATIERRETSVQARDPSLMSGQSSTSPRYDDTLGALSVGTCSAHPCMLENRAAEMARAAQTVMAVSVDLHPGPRDDHLLTETTGRIYGLTTIQVYQYHRRYSHDHLFMRTTVSSSCQFVRDIRVESPTVPDIRSLVRDFRMTVDEQLRPPRLFFGVYLALFSSVTYHYTVTNYTNPSSLATAPQ